MPAMGRQTGVRPAWYCQGTHRTEDKNSLGLDVQIAELLRSILDFEKEQ